MTLREQFDAKAKKHGWKNADEFLGYVTLHSQTNLARFNGAQIGLALFMAGDETLATAWLAHPDMWRSVDMRDLVKKTDARLDHELAIAASSDGAGI